MRNAVMLFMVCISVLLTGYESYGQSWLDFSHPNERHLDMTNPDIHIGIPDLLNTPDNITVTRPTLVVLMEFSDMQHRAVHTTNFWSDLVFGNPRTGGGGAPSVYETFKENSNGRLLLGPATAGDVHDGNADGVVGWVASTQSAFTLTDPEQKRAEGVRVADPLFDYNVYDTNNDGVITTDELLIIVVFADNAPVSPCCFQNPVPAGCVCPCCDMHDPALGHPRPNGCVGCPGGNTRQTNPSQVAVDQDTQTPVSVFQWINGIGEIAHTGVVSHETGHSTFGLGDLYHMLRGGACQGPGNYQVVEDGYFCDGKWYPFPPIYSVMDESPRDYVPHLSPWEKIHLGFLKPLVITHDGTYTLHDAETERNFSVQDTSPEAMIIYDPLGSEPYREYFILENRNQTLLPDQGLALWFINENSSNWPSGLNFRFVNRLIRRGGYTVANQQSLWDGINQADGYDITATSNPIDSRWTNGIESRWIDGSPSYIEIKNITPAGPTITFDVVIPPIFVDSANTGAESGSQASPFNTVGEAVTAIPVPPRTIRISGGSYPEAITINKPCTLKGWRNGNVIIGE